MELEGYEKHILVKHYAILVKVKKYMLHRHHTFNFGYFVDWQQCTTIIIFVC